MLVNCKRARVWIENEHAIAVPDAFPVADGHTLVVPRKHVMTIYPVDLGHNFVLADSSATAYPPVTTWPHGSSGIRRSESRSRTL